MRIRAALAYLKDNHEKLKDPDTYLIGVAYTPTQRDGEFSFISLSLDEEEKQAGFDYYQAWLEAGNLMAHDGIEDSYADEDVEKLVAAMPEYVSDMNFQVYTLTKGLQGYLTEYTLYELFPSLPNPDDFVSRHGLIHFKAKALELVNNLNKQ